MERGYKLDAVWRAGRRSYEDCKNVVGCGKPLRTSYPLAMFEVQIEGSVDTALSRLKHARELWVCRLFPVVSERQARERAQDLLEALKGAFHEINDQVEIIHAEGIARPAEDLKKHREILETRSGERAALGKKTIGRAVAAAEPGGSWAGQVFIEPGAGIAIAQPQHRSLYFYRKFYRKLLGNAGELASMAQRLSASIVGTRRDPGEGDGGKRGLEHGEAEELS